MTPRSIATRLLRSVRFAFFGRKKAFSHIFRSRYWGDAESVSGVGSSLAQTESIRRELPKIVDRFEIRSIKDPFGFPADEVIYRFPDYADPMPSREMLLFHRKALQGRILI